MRETLRQEEQGRLNAQYAPTQYSPTNYNEVPATGLRGLPAHLGGLAGATLANNRTASLDKLGVAKGANTLAAMRLGYDMNKDQRDYATGRSDKAFEQQKQAREDKRAETEQANKLGNENEARVEKFVREDAEAESTAKDDGMMGNGRKRADYVKQEGDQRMQDIRHTTTLHGISTKTLSDDHLGTMLAASRLKAKYNNPSSSLGPMARDLLHNYFGDNQVTSHDLMSYMPLTKAQAAKYKMPAAEVSMEPIVGGGRYRIKMPNGGSAELKQFAGGRIQWAGSNEPIDKDAARIFQPLIDEYEAAHKGGK